jgi:hypothetical protein
MDRTNYLSWKSQFKDILEMHGLTTVVKNNTEPPKVQEDRYIHLELAKDKLVLSWIKATSSSSIKTLLIPCTTAHQAWTMLAKRLHLLLAPVYGFFETKFALSKRTTTPQWLIISIMPNHSLILSYNLVQQWTMMNSSVMF